MFEPGFDGSLIDNAIERACEQLGLATSEIDYETARFSGVVAYHVSLELLQEETDRASA